MIHGTPFSSMDGVCVVPEVEDVVESPSMCVVEAEALPEPVTAEAEAPVPSLAVVVLPVSGSSSKKPSSDETTSSAEWISPFVV